MVAWALAMAGLPLPPYVLWHIFELLAVTDEPFVIRRTRSVGPVRTRVGHTGIGIAADPLFAEYDQSFVHVCVEDMTHNEVIQVLILACRLRNAKSE